MIFQWLSAPFRALGYAIMTPIRGLRAGLYGLRAFSPMGILRSSTYGMTSQLRNIASLPRQYLGINLGAPQVNLPNGMGLGGKEGSAGTSANAPASPLDDSRIARIAARQQRARSRPLPQRREISQLHLFNTLTQERRILHIGSVTGVDGAELVLAGLPANTAAHLRFELVDSERYGTPLWLHVIAADAEVRVDGKAVQAGCALPAESVLHIGEASYTCNLFAWDRLPVRTSVDAAWGSDVGPVRDVNQDALGIFQHRDNYLFAVADGVGGGYAGEEVSAFAIRYLLTSYSYNLRGSADWRDVLAQTFSAINREVRRFADATPHGAGTTLTAAVIDNWTAYIAHVGDSRLYLWRMGVLRQITTDHMQTVATQTPDGTIQRTVLQKAIGKEDGIEPQLIALPLQPDDMLLLASDGITRRVSDEELSEMLAERLVTGIPEKLIRLANGRENDDNASAIVLQVLPEAYERDFWSVKTDEEGRVFAGIPSRQLRLEHPREIATVYAMPRRERNGWLVFWGAVLLAGLLYLWLRPSESPTPSNANAAGDVPTSVTPVGNLPSLANTEVAPLIQVLPSNTPRPSQAAPTASATPMPTRTPAPTKLVPSATATPIPATSTLRAPNR